MHNNKSFFDFYQSSGIYDRVIFKQEQISQTSTIFDLKKEILLLKNDYNKNEDQLIFSDGNSSSKIMIIGDVPGTVDEINQKPFTGEDGKLLDKMLSAINLDRSGVYLTNIINYRLPDNKKPTDEDIKKFKPLIYKHIQFINPKLIFLLGAVTLETFYGKNNSILKARGNWLQLTVNKKQIDCMPSLHPSFLLRQPDQKKLSWLDLKKFKQKIIENNWC